MDRGTSEVKLTDGDGNVIFEGSDDEFTALADKIGSVAKPHLAGAAGQLKALVERIERINSDIADLQGDAAEIYKEAKMNGFDVPALRKVVAERKKDPRERDAQLSMFQLYWDAAR